MNKILITSRELIEVLEKQHAQFALDFTPFECDQTIREMLVTSPDAIWVVGGEGTYYTRDSIGQACPAFLQLYDAVEPHWSTDSQAEKDIKTVMKYYIIEKEWVGSNDEQHADSHTYTITTDTPVTNMSGEERLEGWLGTTNNWSAHAHGEFASVEAAVAKIMELLEGDYREDEHTNPGEVAVYRVGKYQPYGRNATRDWISTGPDVVLHDTTDAQIEEWADNCVYDGRSDVQIELDRDAVVEWYEERREDAREKNKEMIEEKITEIMDAKVDSGEEAYLFLDANSGDCILWPSEASSENDDGANALSRWTLTKEEVEALEDADTESDTGIIDGRN